MADKQETYSTPGKAKAASSQGKASSPDKLTKAGKKGDIELSEDELKAAAGGIVIQGGILYKEQKGGGDHRRPAGARITRPAKARPGKLLPRRRFSAPRAAS